MSNGAQPASGGARSKYRVLRELGARSLHSYAAIREPHELLVAQRFVRVRGGEAASAVSTAGQPATPLDGETMALLLRDARCLAKSWHPNIARVKHVDLVGPDRPELTIATELLDGATLADLFEAAQAGRTAPRSAPLGHPPLPLPVLVRIMLDVLAGLHALHQLRDGLNVPLGAIHGELCPANVVVGRDGVTRIVNVLRRRPVHIAASSEAVGYAAPEALDAGGTDDPRSDVYAAGVMLWEGIVGARLYTERDPAIVLSRQRECETTPPSIDPNSPLARLGDVAMRALSFDPALRFQSVTEMATELRKVGGARLASGSVVATYVDDLEGERIRTRRALLDPAISGTQRRAPDRSPKPSSYAVKASPRGAAPTVRAETPSALIDASRTYAAEAFADELDVETDEDEELPGPRGSSPELDVDMAIALASRGAAEAAPSPSTAPRLPAITPMTPNLPFPGIPAPAATAARELPSPARAAASVVRAVAVANKADALLAPTSTPGDFVIPIEVTATLHEGPPRTRRRRGIASFALAGAIGLLAMGAFVALRAHPSRNAASEVGVATALPPALTSIESAPLPDATAIASTPTARATSTTLAARYPVVAPATAEADAAAAAPAPAPAPAPPIAGPGGARLTPRAPAAPQAKPKKSIYDPDEL